MENINDTQKLLNEIALLKKDINTLTKALYLAGEYSRKNPPANLPENTDYWNMLVGGEGRDPEGFEYAFYWLEKIRAQEKN